MDIPCSTLILAFFFFSISSCSSSLTSHAQLLPAVDDQEGNAFQLQTYIVHVLKPKGTKILTDSDHENWHRSFLPNTTLDSGEPRLIYSYSEVLSGFAARLTPKEVKAMESMDGFLRAWPEERHPLLTTYTPAFLGLSQNNGTWYNCSFGKGIIIGVLDTGILPTHPSFNDDGMPPPPCKWKGNCDLRTCCCNNKLIGASAFIGGRPFPVEDDDNGHGTHAASIAAGNFVDGANVLGMASGTASGMAPRAHLAIYKVCTGGSCADSDILAGIDQAIRDKVDVLSISISTGRRPLYADSIAIGTYAAMRRRILACVAAGNEGPYSSSIVNDAPWILTIGASTTDRRISVTVRLGNGTELHGESAYQPSSFPSTLLPIVFPGFEGQGGRHGCHNDSFDDIDVQGKIVLCENGYGISNIAKGENVKMAGGAAMIVLNQVQQGSTTFAEAHVLPAAHLSYLDALNIISYFNSSMNSTPTAAMLFNGTQFGVNPSPMVASFSSRGPSQVNGAILKPDIIGPGSNILGAWPTNVGPSSIHTSTPTFNFLSGTSMAAPHLAGVAALLKNTHRHWSPAKIKSAIMTTADRFDHNGKPISDENYGRANLFAIGAGHVNPSRANDPGLVYNLHSFSYIRYLCGLGYTDLQIMLITQHWVRCSWICNTNPEELNYPSISVTLGSASVKIVRRKAKNVGEEDSVYFAQIEEPEGVRVQVYPYKLQFTKLRKWKKYHIIFTRTSGSQSKGMVSEAQITWVSRNHAVRTPISITFS